MKPIQIVSADGWWAYEYRNGRVGEVSRLALFALCEDEADNVIVGIDEMLDVDYATTTVDGMEHVYVGPDATADDAEIAAFQQEARRDRMIGKKP